MGVTIPGYENLYSITKEGNVFSHRKNRFLKKAFDTSGYSIVCLCKNGKQKTHKIHRLVAEQYIPNNENKKTVNHIDGIKTNNSMYNLEWCTYLENMTHAIKNKLIDNSGEKSHTAKLTDADIPEIRRLLEETNMTQTQIGQIFGVSRYSISGIKLGKTWKHI